MPPRRSRAPLMRWYLEAGVDETIGDDPVDRYAVPAPPLVAPAPPPPPSPQPPPAPPSPARRPSASSPDRAVEDAYALAQAATTVEALRQALTRFDGCSLKATATNLVFGDGNPRGRVVLIGEGPGAEEDRQGLPFVGQSGRLLDRMLASIGLDRTQVFISNTVFWRPPGNRTPTTQETAVCKPFVERLIELIDPLVLVALGGPAAASLLARSDGVSRLRGRWYEYASPGLARPIAATATYHPAYLLRTPAQKRAAWQDMLMLREKLDALGV